MTDRQIFDATTGQGSEELQMILKVCSETGSWCLIGGLALNTHLNEPRFTRDADIVFSHDQIDTLCLKLKSMGFKIERFPYSINISGSSRVFFQICTDPAYADFPSKAVDKTLWGIPVKSACLEDLIKSKLRSSSEPARRNSKRIQDLADLERIREEFPEYASSIPEVSDQFSAVSFEKPK